MTRQEEPQIRSQIDLEHHMTFTAVTATTSTAPSTAASSSTSTAANDADDDVVLMPTDNLSLYNRVRPLERPPPPDLQLQKDDDIEFLCEVIVVSDEEEGI